MQRIFYVFNYPYTKETTKYVQHILKQMYYELFVKVIGFLYALLSKFQYSISVTLLTSYTRRKRGVRFNR